MPPGAAGPRETEKHITMISLELEKRGCVLVLMCQPFFTGIHSKKHPEHYSSLGASEVGRGTARQTLPEQVNRVFIDHSSSSREPGYAVPHLSPGLQCPGQSSNQETGRKGG